MNGGLSRLLVAMLVVGLVAGVGGSAVPIGAAPLGALDGSFTTALALRRAATGGPFRQAAQVILLMPTESGVTESPVSPAMAPVHIVGWRDAASLLFVRSADGGYEMMSYDPTSGAGQPLTAGLDLDWRYALAPDRTRVVSWPYVLEGAAPFTDLRVYDAATMTLRGEFPIPAAGLAGAGLAGWHAGRAYFFTQTPGDVFLMVDLNSGMVSGPIDLLAPGDGDESIADASLSTTSGLALVGRINPKNLSGVYTVPLQIPDYWPVTTPQEPRPSAQSQARTFSAVDEAQRVRWSHDGGRVAIVAATPGEFGFSSIYLADPAFAAATVAGGRAAFDSCVLFTPDDRWLLYVGEAGDSLMALSLADPGAPPQLLVSGPPALDLCEAAWQPATGQTISGGTGGTGGVTLGGGETPAAEPIAVGEVATGQITNETFAVDYAIALGAGEVITVSMLRRGGELDPLLIIFDPDGRELARNDDAAVQIGDTFVNAQIVDFTAPADGTYTIQATRFQGQTGLTTGMYELRVEAGGRPVAQPPAAIAVGDTVTGQIAGDVHGVEYLITLAAGQSITVTMQRQSGDLDPYLSIRDAVGGQLAYNDDAATTVGGVGLNAQIADFVAPFQGTYSILATRYLQQAGTTTGQYVLSGPPGRGGGGLPSAVPIRVGDSVIGEITDARYAVDYAITLRAGEAITVTMERQGGSLDAYLSILDPSGRELAFNDDAAVQVGISTLNAQIENFTAPADGTYTIRATRLLGQEGATSGQYLLRVTGASGLRPTPIPTVTPFVLPTPVGAATTVVNGVETGQTISVGQTRTGEIRGDVYAVEYAITLRAGETIAVTMQQLDGNLDAVLVIWDPNDQAAAINDDAPTQIGTTTYNAHITSYTAPVDGTYDIWATRYRFDEGDTTGRFEISVTVGTPSTTVSGGAVRPGETVTGSITAAVWAVDYTITLRAGETITVTMERLDGDLDPYLIIMDNFGNDLVFNDDAETQVGGSSLNAQIAGFVAPGDGTYVIRATRYFQAGGSSAGSFQVRVEGGAAQSNQK